MLDLKTANEIIEKIAQKSEKISPITKDDFELFKKFFNKEKHTYGNSWSYITQGMYGIGPEKKGYKYYDGENLSAMVVYPRVENPEDHAFFWIRPMGPSITKKITQLSQEILNLYDIPIFVKKIFQNQKNKLIKGGFNEIEDFPWHPKVPSEDDVFPERILDIQNTLQTAKKLGRTRQLNRSLKIYEKYKNNPDLKIQSISQNKAHTIDLIHRFFKWQHNNKKLNVSIPYDYFNLIENSHTENVLEGLIYIKDNPVGLYYAEKQKAPHASLYASITDRDFSNDIIDFLIFHLLNKLNSEAKGIKYLNLGGSEQKSLDEFKQKFKPTSSQSMHWAVLY